MEALVNALTAVLNYIFEYGKGLGFLDGLLDSEFFSNIFDTILGYFA